MDYDDDDNDNDDDDVAWRVMMTMMHLMCVVTKFDMTNHIVVL